MPELRVAVLRDDPYLAWQSDVLSSVGGLEGVAIMEAATDCDLVLDLTGVAAPTETETWRLRFGEGDAAQPPERPPLILSTLTSSTQGAIGRVCAKASSRPKRNVEQAFQGAAFLFARAVRARLAGADLTTPPLTTPQARVRSPFRWLQKHFFDAQWRVGLVEQSLAELLRDRRLRSPTWLKAPEGRFFADPFPLTHDGEEIHILLENGEDRPPYHGKISKAVYDGSGKLRRLEDVVSGPAHASFPFLFESEGRTYCLPERHQAGELRAYVLDGGKWLPDKVLLADFPAVDPALIEHGGRWWLFTCTRAHDDITHLYLFSAPHWPGPWMPHPLNPIVSDVRCARPAGALFVHDGALWRPAQDCSERYGGALAVQRIIDLSERTYREETMLRLTPEMLGPGWIGLHTLNALGDRIVIDGLQLRRKR